MKKKLLQWTILPIFAIALSVGLSSFTNEDEGGSGGNWRAQLSVCEIYSPSAGGYIDNGLSCIRCVSGTKLLCVSTSCEQGDCSEWKR